MKRIARLLILLLILAATAWANPISEQQARNNAIEFLLTKYSMARGGDAIQAKLAMKHEQGRYFVFNVGNADGYVVVSGDDCTPYVLGYADEGSFDASKMPPHMKAWLQSYADQIEYLQKHATHYEQAPLNMDGYDAIAPLITTKWDQDAPYNSMCPIDPVTNQRSAVGCMATAMAQILYYHKATDRNIATIPAYTTKTHKIQMPEIAPTQIEWDAIDNNYVGIHSEASKNAIAQLMLLCGQALEMDYTSKFSGAYNTKYPLAFHKYFGFSANARVISRNHYFQQAWNDAIYNELANKRPVLYSGTSVGGAHAFIIDGYDHDGYFHVNWGWEGMSDGYFLLGLLNPHSNTGIGASTTNDGYSFEQEAVLGVEPATQATGVYGAPLTIYDLWFDGGETLARTSNGFSIDLHARFFNVSGEAHDYLLGLGVFDKDGQLCDYKYFDQTYNLGHTVGFNDYKFNPFYFGKNLTDGTYRIQMLCSDEKDSQFQTCLNSHVNYIQAVVNGNMITYQRPTFNLTGTIVQNDIAETFAPIFMSATIQNLGTDFCDDIFVFANNVRVGGYHLEALAGETIQLDFDCIVQTAGSHTISLCYQSNNSMIPFATLPINVDQGVTTHHLDYSVSISNLVNGVMNNESALITVNVTNNESHIYSNQICLGIFKRTSNTGNYENYISDTNRTITIRPGGSSVINYEMGPLEANAEYIAAFYYISDNTWTNNGSDYYVQFKTAQELTPVGVSAPKATQQSQPVFTLDGRRIRNASTTQLPHGIYIVGGKKRVF
jgi:hypothetical protein